MVRRALAESYRLTRKLVIGAVGASVVLVGVAMLVLPGPAVLVIPLGLGILALEFAWAARWLERMRATARSAIERTRRS